MRLTEERRAAFLRELAAHGIVARAARAASPHSAKGAIKTFRDARRADPEFAAAWDEAMEEARGAVESELHRRAVEGWEEPVYGGRYKEIVVGKVRRYSDRLLELRAKALLPEYRDTSRAERVVVQPEAPAALAALGELTEDERRRLKDLLTDVVQRKRRS